MSLKRCVLGNNSFKSIDLSLADFLKFQRESFWSLMLSKSLISRDSFISGKLRFRQLDTTDSLIDGVFKSIFPISDSFSRVFIDYISCRVELPKYDESYAIHKSVSYEAGLYATFRMILYKINEDTGSSEIAVIKDQEVFVCTIPLMVDSSCSFVVNGVERVVISQLHRAPGVFLENDSELKYRMRVIPESGNWIDLEIDGTGVMHVKIGKKRRIPMLTFLSAFNFALPEVYDLFSDKFTVRFTGDVKKCVELSSLSNSMKRGKVNFDILDATGGVAHKSGAKIKSKILKDIESESSKYYINIEDLREMLIVSSSYSEALVGNKFSESMTAGCLKSAAIISFADKDSMYNPQFLMDDKMASNYPAKADAMRETLKTVLVTQGYDDKEIEDVFNRIFFDKFSFNLSEIGRYKINKELGTTSTKDVGYLTKQDIEFAIKRLVRAKVENEVFLDSDSLSNRRLRSVGELLRSKIESSLTKMTRIALDKMNSPGVESLLPADILSFGVVQSGIREFFLLSRLSQFVEQTNPLADVVHKRRITALGAGGLTKERAGFEVRDVHASHYGRICPIETPEGQSIGLINSPACYSRLNEYGFFTAPYLKVTDGKVASEPIYLDYDEEAVAYVLPFEGKFFEKVGESLTVKSGFVICRHKGNFVTVDSKLVGYIEASPRQILSFSSSLIPFIERDDASRALMGANMQRQAVPLLEPAEPIVATGFEADFVSGTNVSIKAVRDGVVSAFVHDTIIVRTADLTSPIDLYKLDRFKKTNHGTSFTHRPIVSVGQQICKGDIIAEGASIKNGELALGKDVVVAFMPFDGYNFEDAIVCSERVAKSGFFSSVHIDELEISVRDTKLGPEEVTKHLPNIQEGELLKLDESGIVQIGAVVAPGDILVGKVTPKIDEVLTPEEKLLRAIFGDKSGKFKNTSLIVPPDVKGTVIDVRISSRNGIKKTERQKEIEQIELMRLKQLKDIQEQSIADLFLERFEAITSGAKVVSKIDAKKQKELSLDEKLKLSFDTPAVNKSIAELSDEFRSQIDLVREEYKVSIANLLNFHDIKPGVLTTIKVYVANELKLQPGDKMAGRHGNKGVISKILPVEDMPFLADGTPVDVVLNPLGVASRMNIGQILETHLGFVSWALGRKMYTMHNGGESRAAIQKFFLEIIGDAMDLEYLAQLTKASDAEFIALIESWKDGVLFKSLPFEGIVESKISDMLERLGFPRSGKFDLYDGRTGDKFDRPVTVGKMYMLKLHHLIENKVHARSIGTYSLVTQQPLGGKTNFGGQRLGEMECWALQAYGAAFTLQEMLTVKSDDINGRTAVYDSIIRGKSAFDIGIPESFNVMVKELRALCINIELESKDTNFAS